MKPSFHISQLILLSAIILWFGQTGLSENVQEASLNPFLGDPVVEIQTVFEDERFPNVVVSTKGTVLATW